MNIRTKSYDVGSVTVLALFSVIVAMGIGARGDSTFFFYDSWGIYLPGGSTLVPAGSLVQLIWSADAAYHPATAGQLDAAGYLTSGDYILFQGYTTINGGWTGDLDGSTNYVSSDVGGNPLPSGYVYGRVFNTSSSSPTAGTWFVQSTLVQVLNEQTNIPPDSPDVVDMAPSSPAVMDQQVAIPEPGSLALLGVGAVALILRRRS